MSISQREGDVDVEGPRPRMAAKNPVENRLAGDDMSRKFVAATCVLTLAFFVWQVVWAILTPAFRAPDEPLHVNSVVRVAQGQGWPDPGEARVSSSVVQAVQESGLISADSENFNSKERTRVVGSREIYPRIPRFGDNPVTPHAERIAMSAVDGSTTIVDQMTQHPPLFYELQAVAFRAVGADDWPWDRQLLLMRVVSALMTMPLVPCTVFATRRAGASRRMALTAGVLVFAVPQLVYVTGSLNNDALAIGAGALCLAAASAAMFGSGGWRTVWAAGLALGLGLWSKGTFIPMGLTVGLAFLANVGSLTWRQRLVRAVSAGGIGILTGGFWWGRNIVLFGVLQPAGYQSAFLLPGSSVRYFIRAASTNLIESFWGRFDWMDWPLDTALVWSLAIATWIVILVSVATGPRRMQRLVLLSFFVFVSGMLLAQAWTQYSGGGVIPGTQGRYLFPGIVGLFVVCVLSLGSIGRALRRIVRCFLRPAQVSDAVLGPSIPSSMPPQEFLGSLRQRLAPLLVTIPAVLIAAYSAGAWARACYPMPPEGSSPASSTLAHSTASGVLEMFGSVVVADTGRWLLVAGLSPELLAAVVVLGACALLIAVVTPLVVAPCAPKTFLKE